MGRILQVVRGSLVIKVFAVCFGAIHLPLISLLLYLGLGRPADPVPMLVVALVATLLGSALAFLAVYQFVSPIDRLVKAMDRYQQEGVEPFVEVRGSDGLRRLADKLLSLVRAQELNMRTLQRQANSDPLTGLGNRRWLHNAVSVEMSRAARRDQWVWVVVFDLDHFKTINDTYGHAAGDDVLMTVAEVTHRQVRPYDLLARVGGEEFCIVATDDAPSLGIIVAERIRAALESCNPIIGGIAVPVTASFGVHRGDPRTESFADMLRRADAGLYAAKGNGRNLVVDSKDAPPIGDLPERVPLTIELADGDGQTA